MYRQDTLRCPSCEAGLAPLVSPVAVHGCNACGGLWLGPDATVHVMRGLEDELDQWLAREGRQLAASARAVAKVPEGERVCPVCTRGLSRVDVTSIRIDTCFTHGSWFDTAEIVEVVDVCSNLRAPDEVVDTAMPEVLRPLWNAIARFCSGR